MTISPTTQVSAAEAGPADDRAAMTCVYCRIPIPAESFGSWPGAHLMQSARCPDCQRMVGLTAASMSHELISVWWPGTGEGETDAPQ